MKTSGGQSLIGVSEVLTCGTTRVLIEKICHIPYFRVHSHPAISSGIMLLQFCHCDLKSVVFRRCHLTWKMMTLGVF